MPRTHTLQANSDGKILKIGCAGAHGLAVLPWLPDITPRAVAGDSIGRDKVGSYPADLIFGGSQLLTVHNSEALYFLHPMKEATLEGVRDKEWFRFVILEQGEVYIPGHGKVRRAFELVSNSNMPTTSPAVGGSDGFEVRSSWKGWQLIIPATPAGATGVTVKYWANIPGIAPGAWVTSEIITEAGIYYRAVEYPSGRIYIQSDTANEKYSFGVVAEVG